MKFWGARGSIPVPGPSTIKYGGNTSCVEIRLPSGKMIILDAGTGLHELGKSLDYSGGGLNIHLFITHYHWDHIQGLPFFQPAYHPNNVINILGVEHPDFHIENIISAQMEPIHFPVSLTYLKAEVEFDHILESGFHAEEAHIRTTKADHTGHTLCYRIDCDGKSIVFMTDNELDRKLLRGNGEGVKRLNKFINFASGADLLIHDAQYLDKEYVSRKDWGHSTWQDAEWLAREADVKNLVLFHHDPERVDYEVDLIVEECKKELAIHGSGITCYGASEKLAFSL